MKELTTTNLTQANPNHGVSYSSNSPPDDENSSDNDLIQNNKKLLEQQQQQKSLPSIGSLITQEIQHINNDTNPQRCVNNNTMTKSLQNFDPIIQQNDMEWTDTEFLKLCDEFPNDLLINGNSTNYAFEGTNNQNNTNDYVINQSNQMGMFNHQPTNSNGNLNFNNNEQLAQHQQTNMIGNNQFLNSQLQNQQPNLNVNSSANGDANLMIPWEFDHDLNQIATYLHTPAV